MGERDKGGRRESQRGYVQMKGVWVKGRTRSEGQKWRVERHGMKRRKSMRSRRGTEAGKIPGDRLQYRKNTYRSNIYQGLQQSRKTLYVCKEAVVWQVKWCIVNRRLQHQTDHSQRRPFKGATAECQSQVVLCLYRHRCKNPLCWLHIPPMEGMYNSLSIESSNSLFPKIKALYCEWTETWWKYR